MFSRSRSRTLWKRRGLPGILLTVVAALLTARPAYGQPVPDPTDLDADGVPGVAGSPGPGSEVPEVVALTGTGNMLIDRSHGQDVDVSGFTDLLQSQGWVIEELQTGPVTDSTLSNSDVFLVPIRLSLSMLPFSAAEVAAVSAYVSNGGGLWLFHESDRDPTGINSLSSTFGVVFYQDFLRDPTNNEGQVFWPTIHLLQDHPVTQGVASYGYYSGCCLGVNPPAMTIGMGDDDAFSSNCPSFPPTLASYESSGRVVFSGDIAPLTAAYYPELLRDEEELLLQNIASWLLQKPPTATRATSWGGIKMLYR